MSVTMTLTEKSLHKWSESTRTSITEEQKKSILDRFAIEPEPDEWSEQDIGIQIQNFLGCGEFVKTIKNNGHPSTLPVGVDF
jgi:hypothetical protein